MTLGIIFALIVGFCLALDLGVFHRKAREVSLREALFASCFWIVLALGFNLIVYFHRGSGPALDFFTGYVIEKVLSIDNIFVILTIFTLFQIAPKQRYRILLWGVLGAVIFRMILIFAGIELLNRFSWLPYLLGVFLIWSGARMMISRGKSFDLEKMRKWFPFRKEIAALCAIELTDIVFAVDSVPAIFAITMDPLIVYTSNIFAILGLRSLTFVFAHFLNKMKGLEVSLAAILVLVGVKFLAQSWIHIPTGVMLGCIIIFLALSPLFHRK